MKNKLIIFAVIAALILIPIAIGAFSLVASFKRMQEVQVK